MKFIINKEVLFELLQKNLGPTTTKQNFPILSSLLITSNKDGLKFTTTDLDTTIISFQEINTLKQGEVAIPMKRFISIIRELPSGEILIEKIKNNLLIKCEKIEFKINTLNHQEFPPVEEKKEASLIKVNPQNLEEMIRLTSFCVGYENTSYVLNGIFFEIEKNQINLVSTDGKRLSWVKKNLDPTQPELETKLSFIIPIKAINELVKLLKDEEEVFIWVEEKRVGFDFKKTQLIVRPIEGEFPEYSQYIPKDRGNKLIVNRKELLAGLRRADLLFTPDYQGVKLEIKKDSVLISKTTPQLGEVEELIPASYKDSPLTIGFNPRYLIDVLRSLDDDEVCFEFFGSEKAAVLRKEGYLYLVLPMKI